MPANNAPIEVTPEHVDACRGQGTPILDIRTDLERGIGVATGSTACTAERILARARSGGEESLKTGFIMCAAGVRSRALVDVLRAEGFEGFSSVKGGYRAWSDAGLASDYPDGLDAGTADRYARHLVMPQVGPSGQTKLLQSRVLLVGMGGLNSPAALYLAAAGVGTLGLVDDDRVERSNLQRQIIHSDQTVGESKVQSAKNRILALNPGVNIEVFESRLDGHNAAQLVKNWQVVIDGSDNFDTRYAVNVACMEEGIPLVYGAVMRFQGQVSVFAPHQTGAVSPCYRCLFPHPPSAEEAPNCAVAGVLGVMPGIVGTLQACEALKLLLGIGQPLMGRLLMIDALNMDFREARIEPDPACPDCGIKTQR